MRSSSRSRRKATYLRLQGDLAATGWAAPCRRLKRFQRMASVLSIPEPRVRGTAVTLSGSGCRDGPGEYLGGGRGDERRGDPGDPHALGLPPGEGALGGG